MGFNNLKKIRWANFTNISFNIIGPKIAPYGQQGDFVGVYYLFNTIRWIWSELHSIINQNV